MEETSIGPGMSPVKTFGGVTTKFMAPGALPETIPGWITCIDELSSSVTLCGDKTSTISVTIYTEAVRSSHDTAAALTSILAVSTVIILLIFLKVSKGRVSTVQYVQKPEVFCGNLQAFMRKMERKYMVEFGTDGWRTITGEELTEENIQKLALVICLEMKEEGMENQGVVVGYDG